MRLSRGALLALLALAASVVTLVIWPPTALPPFNRLETSTTAAGAALYRELEAKYQLTGEGYHTWPFQPSAVSGVSITAGLTLLGNVAAILYRMY